MKRCPECQEAFADTQNYCDVHGVPLVDDTTFVRESVDVRELEPGWNGTDSAAGRVGSTVTIGILIGIIICLLVYLILLAPSRQPGRFARENRSVERELP